MKAQVIQIGNSQGIRIPKTLLEETGISGEVELEANADGILIRNITKPRGDWDAIFVKMAESEDDQAIENEPPAAFDNKEWQW